jgi:uncharacterized protein (DUF427 family)
MAMRAVWKGEVLAESDETRVVEGNHYFPPDSINQEYFKDNDHHTVCPWKGVASYYDVVVEGDVNRSAAWYYPDPSAAAQEIKGYVAFWNGVRVERTAESGGEVNGDSALNRALNSLFDR